MKRYNINIHNKHRLRDIYCQLLKHMLKKDNVNESSFV